MRADRRTVEGCMARTHEIETEDNRRPHAPAQERAADRSKKRARQYIDSSDGLSAEGGRRPPLRLITIEWEIGGVAGRAACWSASQAS